MTEEIKQIVYALERSIARLDDFADKLAGELDYAAEFPAEDADRHREAIAYLQRYEAIEQWQAGGEHLFLSSRRGLGVAFALGAWWADRPWRKR